MASTGTEREEPHVPLDKLRHPEPAFREAQKWIEEVTGKSFGEKDFRSGLENGILLCELLCSIRPGLVQKINRLPSPIAGLDNLSVFLRGCEELGLKGSQLFNPGDLQDTSIQANLRDSECSRKLKNVLITIFWLGKASNVCPSYDGPVLNLREFEGLRSHMRTVCVCLSGSDSVRPGVRDSGYDCWDSERSQSLSPRQHTRDNSLDSLDSFGSRSQTSPSPDVIIHGNSDDGDAPNRKGDVRRDDMLARRTSAGESRTFVPFNQFLPNRNVSAYVPTARRRSRPQDGEHGRYTHTYTHTGRSISIINMHSEEEGAGLLQPLGQSRYDGMQEQYTNHQEEEEWQDDLARWKSRRRSASQDLIRKEEERKRMERMMKEEEGGHTQKKKNIKTYREIVEDKERREAELCDAYRRAGSKAEAAMVLQRYALRFTISDSTLDSLQLPRTITTDQNPDSRTPATNQNPEFRTTTTNQNLESRTITTNQNPESKTITTDQNPESRTITTDQNPNPRTSINNQNSESTTITTDQNSESTTITTDQNPESRTITTDQNLESRTISTDQNPKSRTITSDQNPESRTITTDQNPNPRTIITNQNPESRTITTQVSAVSALIGGRNCVVTTTIVTELTQTHLQPRPLDMLSNTQMESPMLNLAKRVDHWVWNPEDERRRQEKWQQEQERFLQEQYLREQDKLKGEWERAQREVDEEERRHNEEVANTLAFSISPDTHIGLYISQGPSFLPSRTFIPGGVRGRPLELSKTPASQVVDRSLSYRTASASTPKPTPSTPPSQHVCVYRCVSGKRQCSGCNQALGKGTAMNIDTLGLYFHLTCFKCGVCKVQLGDTSSGTDVRIRNGLLSCHDCYATSHADQPVFPRLT
uniref:LIM and calponin homology domains-containing protein 1-like n=1 Tax=Oncorhynchus mykiss TaxID=8022 RepID=A0A8K9V6N0_ONCMY